MKNKIAITLILLLMSGLSFIGGLAVGYTPNLSLLEKSKKAVEDFLFYPQASVYKNVEYHPIRETVDHGTLGFVCGNVLTFKDENPSQFSRFIVKTYDNKDGRDFVSIPLIDKPNEEFPQAEFNEIWNKYCK